MVTKVAKSAKAVDRAPNGADVLAGVMADINKEFGVGTVRLMADAPTVVDMMPTGLLRLDLALGGGLPRGRIVEVFGPTGCGKTTLSLQLAAQAQRCDPERAVAYIDAEHALVLSYAAELGVDVDALLISQPDSGEQALTVALRLAKCGAVSLIILDSVAAMTPQEEIDGGLSKQTMGAQARMMSKGLRALPVAASRGNATVLFVNQIREKVGVMFGSPETTPGGRALPFAASVRLDMRRREPIKVGPEQIGNITAIKTVKNRFASPFQVAEELLHYGRGFNAALSCIEAAKRYGVIESDGSHQMFWRNQLLGKGKEAVRMRLEDDPALLDRIAADVRQLVTNGELPSIQQDRDGQALADTPEAGASGLEPDPSIPCVASLVRDVLMAASGQAIELAELAMAAHSDPEVVAKHCAKLEVLGQVIQPLPQTWAWVASETQTPE